MGSNPTATSEGPCFSSGDVLREAGAWVTVERAERYFCDPDEGMCSTAFGKGFHHTLHCRTATEAEYAELEAAMTAEEIEAEKRFAALEAADALNEEAEDEEFEPTMVPPAEGSEKIVIARDLSGLGEWWLIEPAGAPNGRLIRVSYRGGDGDIWVEGSFGEPCQTGRALPWTAEREAIIRTAEPYWRS